MNNKISCSHLLSSLTVHCMIVAIGWSSLLLRITCGMATLFHNCSRLGFVPLEALEGLSTQRVWHSASQRGDRDRVKCARRSRAIHCKINDDVCGFHPVLYATQTSIFGEVYLFSDTVVCAFSEAAFPAHKSTSVLYGKKHGIYHLYLENYSAHEHRTSASM